MVQAGGCQDWQSVRVMLGDSDIRQSYHLGGGKREREGNPLLQQGMCANVNMNVWVSLFLYYTFYFVCIIHSAY